MVGHLVSKCLSQVRLGVLSSSSPGIYTLKKPFVPTIWLKVLKIHCEKLKKKNQHYMDILLAQN